MTNGKTWNATRERIFGILDIRMIDTEEKELFWDRDTRTKGIMIPFIDGGANDKAFMILTS